ncbi:Protein CBG09625 [Caenorhabditis briggsae]|uniref:DUF7808 domain-containing protein n=2 Tax=Caenorhabditis briggsae TaxID=6238 RepID=A0AAE9JLR4_CAEBR|nr:Protein CBG09625 [Caenorhabditis briggsae]ULT89579.1 hypothetical protein L3Y34_008185 [Caenorhabditis briggsae]UMM35383.1 hypothetical protein L5515_008033 [Caenorhabditis briggsae]CAP28986.1 Protein CBG09625 [Caenorhabditis briggsae]
MAVERFLLASILVAAVASESVHWQWREIRCKENETNEQGQASACELQLKEHENDENPRVVPFNTCTDETVNGELKTYCDILCPGADTAYRITRWPQQHKTCFTHTTYRLERREDNFYLWRSGDCRSSTIGFTIRCEFKSPRDDFLSDQELFRVARRLT